MVYEADLLDSKEVEAIKAEILKQAEQYGTVEKLIIPLPSKAGAEVEGVGKVFLEFESLTVARKFREEINGRLFCERSVCAAFYPEIFWKAEVLSLAKGKLLKKRGVIEGELETGGEVSSMGGVDRPFGSGRTGYEGRGKAKKGGAAFW